MTISPNPSPLTPINAGRGCATDGIGNRTAKHLNLTRSLADVPGWKPTPIKPEDMTAWLQEQGLDPGFGNRSAT